MTGPDVKHKMDSASHNPDTAADLIAGRMEQARVAQGMTYDDVARAAGKPYTAGRVRQILKNERTPRPNHIAALAPVLGLTMAACMPDYEDSGLDDDARLLLAMHRSGGLVGVMQWVQMQMQRRGI